MYGLFDPSIITVETDGPEQRLHGDTKKGIMSVMVPLHRQGRSLDIAEIRDPWGKYVPASDATSIGAIVPALDGVHVEINDPRTFKLAAGWTVTLLKILIPFGCLAVWDGDLCHGGTHADRENMAFHALTGVFGDFITFCGLGSLEAK